MTTYVADHKDRALDELYWQFERQPRIAALVSALAEGAQTLEDAQFDLLTSSTLTAATGQELDQWGQLVDERRHGLDDSTYRAVIQVKIKALRTTGKIDELIDIYERITEADEVRYFTHYPAGFRLTAYRTSPMSDRHVRRVKRIMAVTRPAGVAMVLAEAIRPNDAAFESAFGRTFSRTL